MARKNGYTTSLRILSASLLVAGGIFSFSVSVPAVAAASISASSVIDLANRDRANMGLMPLIENAKLSLAAREKAKDMIKNDYFAHTSPEGKDPWYWIRGAGYAYKAAGENLAINYDDAKEQESAWMNSETHRANILNAKYTETGVAVVEGKIGGETSLVTVQMFGMPAVALVHSVQETFSTQKPALLAASESAPVAIPAVPAIQEAQSGAWFEEVWYVATALLIVAVFMAPMTLVTKSVSALYSYFIEEQLFRAAYQAEAMAAALDVHMRAPSIQHSG